MCEVRQYPHKACYANDVQWDFRYRIRSTIHEITDEKSPSLTADIYQCIIIIIVIIIIMILWGTCIILEVGRFR